MLFGLDAGAAVCGCAPGWPRAAGAATGVVLGRGAYVGGAAYCCCGAMGC